MDEEEPPPPSRFHIPFRRVDMSTMPPNWPSLGEPERLTTITPEETVPVSRQMTGTYNPQADIWLVNPPSQRPNRREDSLELFDRAVDGYGRANAEEALGQVLAASAGAEIEKIFTESLANMYAPKRRVHRFTHVFLLLEEGDG